MGAIISKGPLTPAPNSNIITTASSFSSSSWFSTQWQDLNYDILIATSFSSSAPWPDLNYDLLVAIFSRLSSVDLILGVSAVCSSWRAAAKDPRCWKIMDFSDWRSVARRIPFRVCFSHVFKRALALVSDSERIEKTYLSRHATGKDLVLVSNRLPNLHYVSFPNHDLNGKEICSAMTNFKSLKGIEAVCNFFLLTNGAVSHLKSVVEVKILEERNVWSEEGERLRKLLIALLVFKVFPNLTKIESSNFCNNVDYLQIARDNVKYYNISEIMDAYKEGEELHLSDIWG